MLTDFGHQRGLAVVAELGQIAFLRFLREVYSSQRVM